MADIERDPKEWLLDKVNKKWTHNMIADELRRAPGNKKLAQSTVSRNIDKILDGKDLGPGLKKSIPRLFALEDAEAAEEDRRKAELLAEEERRVAEEERRVVEEERLIAEERKLEAERVAEELRLEAERIALDEKAAKLAEAQRLEAERIIREEEAAKLAEAQRLEAERIAQEERERRLRNEQKRKARVLNAAALVNQRLEALGIVDKGNTIFYGDGKRFVENFEDFSYATRGVELVAFAPDDFLFDCGWTAAELRHGISPTERMLPSAWIPPRHMEQLIGLRRCDEMRRVGWPDDEWLWGEMFPAINRWRKLCAMRPAWHAEGRLPILPSFGDVAWYSDMLEVEHLLLREYWLDLPEPMLEWNNPGRWSDAGWAFKIGVSRHENLKIVKLLRRRALIGGPINQVKSSITTPLMWMKEWMKRILREEGSLDVSTGKA